MYVLQLRISGVRSLDSVDLHFTPEEAPGWHVILGANGSGKSSIIRSLALVLAGPKEAAALRQNWNTWRKNGARNSSIELSLGVHPKDFFTQGRRRSKIHAGLTFTLMKQSIGGPRVELIDSHSSQKGGAHRSIWSNSSGWFSASFGPFRRFTGGDQAYDRLFYSNPRLAPHLSAFGEDVALTEGLRWLRELRVKQLEKHDAEGKLLDKLIVFLNNSKLLPHGAQISEVKSEEVIVIDAAGVLITVEQMSDGYRSVLSMTFEILRQMTRAYGVHEIIDSIDINTVAIGLPGVVAIDEVDAHLHPSWQKEIGPWFTRCFPMLQFIVTTHSPIICQNSTTLWRLPNPGTDEKFGRIEGISFKRLVFGSILDAYGTEYFGRDVARSEDSKAYLLEMASLNRKALMGSVSEEEKARMLELRSFLPTRASDVQF
jgi:predicted ATPase